MSFDYFLEGKEAFTAFLKALDTLGIEYQEEHTENRLADAYYERGYDDTSFRKATFSAPDPEINTPRRMVIEEYAAWVFATDETETTDLDVIVYEEDNRPDVESLLVDRSGFDEDDEDEDEDDGPDQE